MELKSIKCPNCNSLVKLEKNQSHCTYCGAELIASYDHNDVRMKELEMRKEQMEQAKSIIQPFFKTFSLFSIISFVIIFVIAIIVFFFIFRTMFNHF